jgi:ABC-2 type transport system permease protein
VIGLISSEWLRMRSRRLVKVLAVLALLGIVAAVLIGGVQSRKPSDGDLAGAERRAERAYDECVAQDAYGISEPGLDVEVFCREQADPSSFLSPTPLQLSEMPEILRGTAFLAILIGLVIGASAVGASWQTGTVTTILSWEPRRMRVLLVRVTVVAIGVVALVTILLGILTALFWVATSLRGIATTPSGWTRELVGVVARVSALAGAASIIGGAIAMLGRNTAAALGAAFVYLAVLEGIVRGLRPALGRFLLGDSITTVVIGHDRQIFDPSAMTSSGTAALTITPLRAALVVAVYALGLLALAAASFRARDVQ